MQRVQARLEEKCIKLLELQLATETGCLGYIAVPSALLLLLRLLLLLLLLLRLRLRLLLLLFMLLLLLLLLRLIKQPQPLVPRAHVSSRPPLTRVGFPCTGCLATSGRFVGAHTWRRGPRLAS